MKKENTLQQQAATYAKSAPRPASPDKISGFWQLLLDSENLLTQIIGGAKPTIDTPGEAAAGLMLYKLNNANALVVSYLRKKGMPHSHITPAQYKQWNTLMNKGRGIVTGDGTLISKLPYATLDAGWTSAGLQYISLLIGESLHSGSDTVKELAAVLTYFMKIHNFRLKAFNTLEPFPSGPATPLGVGQDELTIAVFGDWGTGDDIAAKVSKGIAQTQPHISLHLGDVYYAGTPTEEKEKLLKGHFPTGSIASYTMNSNHEMYTGGHGLIHTALKNKMFGAQDGKTYFAINFQDWVLIGLDSAYFDYGNYNMFLDGALYDDGGLAASAQKAFIDSLQIPKDKKIILFTHHHAVQADGRAINPRLYAQVFDILGGRYPDLWYYGHLHNAIAYTDESAQGQYTTAFGRHPQLRCVGNGAIPYGDGYYFTGTNGKLINEVAYYAHENAGFTKEKQKSLVRNGFAVLTLRHGQLTETFYEVDIKDGGSMLQAWQHTHSF